MDSPQPASSAAVAGRFSLNHLNGNAAQWLADIDADYGTLAEIQRRIEGITAADDDKLRALAEFLRRIFLSEQQLKPLVDSAITEIRNMQIKGDALIRRLEALRDLFRLTPPPPAAPPLPAGARVTRIVCSDGLV